MRLYLTYTLFSFLLQSASSGPTGASSCDGDAPLQGPHLENAKSGGLEDFGLEASLGGVALQTVGPVTVSANQDIPLRLYTTDASKGFRGFLIRLSDPSGESTVGSLSIPDSINEQAQIASVCTDLSVGGATHVNNDMQSDLTINLNVPTQIKGLLDLDVTAVILNRLVDNTWESEYYTTRYRILAVEETGASTGVPTGGPTDGGQESSSATLTLVRGWPTVTFALIVLLAL